MTAPTPPITVSPIVINQMVGQEESQMNMNGEVDENFDGKNSYPVLFSAET